MTHLTKKTLMVMLILVSALACDVPMQEPPSMVHMQALGGNWIIHWRNALPESSASNTELWYGDEQVATVVHSYRYYADDCVAFDSSSGGGQHFLFVCGRHEAFVLGPDSRATWDFGPDTLRQRGIENNATAIDHGEQVMTIADAKLLALKQPLRKRRAAAASGGARRHTRSAQGISGRS